jgi:type IV pilus assembly protein PilM
MSIAIDFGTRNIHLVVGQATGKRLRIDKMVVESIPGGIIQDGVIRDFSALEMALKNLFSTHRLKKGNCIVTINGNHVYTRELDVPKSAPKVLANVVDFEVRNAMNAANDITVEFVEHKQPNADKPNMLHVRASAIQTEYVLDYGKLLKALNLKPAAMDIHPNAITKLVTGRDINDSNEQGRNVMLIDIGCISSTTYVIGGGEIIYTRIIPVGAIEIERYCQNAAGSDKSAEPIPLEQIDLSLNSLRINQPLGDAVRPLVIALTDGVNRIQQFISGRISGNKIEKIYIYGRGSTFPGLEETLSQSISLKVERVRKLSDLTLPPNGDPAPFLNAIGALIRLK